MEVWRATSGGAGTCTLKTPSQRGDLQDPTSRNEAGVHILCRSHTLVGSTGVGWRRSCWGPTDKMRCLAIRPRREVASWVSHTPNMLAKSSLEGCMGTRAASQFEEGQRCGKGGGTGVGTMAGGKGSSADGHDDGLTRPESGSSCEVRSGFPRIRTQPQTGPSIGLPTVA